MRTPRIGRRTRAAALAAAVLVAGVVPAPAFATTAHTSATRGLDLHRVDWNSASEPGSACFAKGWVRMRHGAARWRNDKLGTPDPPLDGPNYVNLSVGPVFYGNLTGDGTSFAAVGLLCDNNGGTADGQLLFSIAVYSGASGHRRLVGLITPRVERPGMHVTIIQSLTMRRGRIIVPEYFYGPYDGTCCASGRAISTWIYKSGRLIWHRSVITRQPTSSLPNWLVRGGSEACRSKAAGRAGHE